MPVHPWPVAEMPATRLAFDSGEEGGTRSDAIMRSAACGASMACFRGAPLKRIKIED